MSGGGAFAFVRELLAWTRPWRHDRRSLARRRDLPPWLARIMAIHGELAVEEVALLHDLAAAARGGCIVELGTFHGRSTVALALGTRSSRRLPVYAIDPYLPATGVCGGHFGPTDKTRLLQNLLIAGVAEEVWLVQTTSREAAAGWHRPVALLWVDGDHREAAVRADIAAWASHVVPGGVIAFHDSLDPRAGVARVLAEWLVPGGEFVGERVLGKTTVVRRRGAVT